MEREECSRGGEVKGDWGRGKERRRGEKKGEGKRGEKSETRRE